MVTVSQLYAYGQSIVEVHGVGGVGVGGAVGVGVGDTEGVADGVGVTDGVGVGETVGVGAVAHLYVLKAKSLLLGNAV